MSEDTCGNCLFFTPRIGGFCEENPHKFRVRKNDRACPYYAPKKRTEECE